MHILQSGTNDIAIINLELFRNSPLTTSSDFNCIILKCYPGQSSAAIRYSEL